MTEAGGIERRKLTDKVNTFVRHNPTFVVLLKTVLASTVELEREKEKEFVAARFVNIMKNMMHFNFPTELSSQNH